MSSSRIPINDILYLDAPHFPGSWPAIVLFTVALTEAHLGTVQIQSCANLLTPFFWLFFFFAQSPSIPLHFSHSLTTHLYVPLSQ